MIPFVLFSLLLAFVHAGITPEGRPEVQSPLEPEAIKNPREIFKNPKQQITEEPEVASFSPSPKSVLEAPTPRGNFRCGQIETGGDSNERIVNGTVSIKGPCCFPQYCHLFILTRNPMSSGIFSPKHPPHPYLFRGLHNLKA